MTGVGVEGSGKGNKEQKAIINDFIELYHSKKSPLIEESQLFIDRMCVGLQNNRISTKKKQLKKKTEKQLNMQIKKATKSVDEKH